MIKLIKFFFAVGVIVLTCKGFEVLDQVITPSGTGLVAWRTFPFLNLKEIGAFQMLIHLNNESEITPGFTIAEYVSDLVINL